MGNHLFTFCLSDISLHVWLVTYFGVLLSTYKWGHKYAYDTNIGKFVQIFALFCEWVAGQNPHTVYWVQKILFTPQCIGTLYMNRHPETALVTKWSCPLSPHTRLLNPCFSLGIYFCSTIFYHVKISHFHCCSCSTRRIDGKKQQSIYAPIHQFKKIVNMFAKPIMYSGGYIIFFLIATCFLWLRLQSLFSVIKVTILCVGL